MLLKVLKYSGLVAVSGGCVAVLQSNDWDVSSLGVVRFGRTAYTVSRIAVDYKLCSRRFGGESEEAKEKWSATHKQAAERMLSLCCTNGGVFIKVGQHIGALDYMVPPEYCETLKVLHNKAPKTKLEDIRRVIATDLGKSTEELFSEFEEEPLGTASLAQVHKATLKDGQVVAVKVQHPLVKKHSLVDMTTMDLLVRIVVKIFPEFSFLWLADEMKINLPLELDFLQEGRNAERVARAFSGFSWLRVPTINWDASTCRVLTMEYLDGGQVTDKKYMIDNKIDVREISNRLSSLYSEMIFTQGYVHCDPHPGNILIKNSKDGPQIILLDHGLYTSLTEKFRHQYSRMWLSMINADLEGIKKWGTELGAGELYPLLACILASKPWTSLTTGLTKTRTASEAKKENDQLREQAVHFLPQISLILSRVPREMLLILKTNDLLRGIETSLGTRGERRSLINMSRYCVRSVYEDQLRQTSHWLLRAQLRVVQQWTLTRLSLYQFYLWACCLVLGTQYR